MRHLRLSLPLVLVVSLIGGIGNGLFLPLLLLFAGIELLYLWFHERSEVHGQTSGSWIGGLGLVLMMSGLFWLGGIPPSALAALVGQFAWSASWHERQHRPGSLFAQSWVRVLSMLVALGGAVSIRY